AQVVVVEHPEIVQLVTQQRHPIDPHAEREAAHALGIVATCAQDVGMDHSRAEDLEPAAALAYPAGGIRGAGGALDAGDVDLGARLGEREEAGPEADPAVTTEHAPPP